MEFSFSFAINSVEVGLGSEPLLLSLKSQRNVADLLALMWHCFFLFAHGLHLLVLDRPVLISHFLVVFLAVVLVPLKRRGTLVLQGEIGRI